MAKGPGLLLPGMQAAVYLLEQEAGIAESTGDDARAVGYRQAADLLKEQAGRMRSIRDTGRADGGDDETARRARPLPGATRRMG